MPRSHGSVAIARARSADTPMPMRICVPVSSGPKPSPRSGPRPQEHPSLVIVAVTPPGWGYCSYTVTLCSSLARYAPAVGPAIPDPITATRFRLVSMGLDPHLLGFPPVSGRSLGRQVEPTPEDDCCHQHQEGRDD